LCLPCENVVWQKGFWVKEYSFDVIVLNEFNVTSTNWISLNVWLLNVFDGVSNLQIATMVLNWGIIGLVKLNVICVCLVKLNVTCLTQSCLSSKAFQSFDAIVLNEFHATSIVWINLNVWLLECLCLCVCVCVWFEKMHFMLATKSMGQIAKVVREGYWLFMACHQQL
jgi:hypothetical protein